MSEVTLEERFSALRQDVRDYLIENSLTPEYGEINRGDNHERLLEYHKHKSSLSKICGWDSTRVNYNQGMFDQSLNYLIMIMGV